MGGMSGSLLLNTSYTILINENNCLGDLLLKVDCVHEAKKTGFIIQLPNYEAIVSYKGGLQCTK